MANPKFKMIFKDRIAPEKGGYPGFNPRTIKDQGMIIEYDVPVTMRDGAKIYTDVFRPDVNAYRPDPQTMYPVLVAGDRYDSHLLVPIIPEQ